MKRLTIGIPAALALALAALTLGSGSAAPAADKPGQRAKLVRFNSCRALNRYARHHPVALRQTGYYGFGLAEDVAPPSANPPATGETAPQSTTTSPAATNVQEAGVDEPDIVKADGSTIYAIANGRLDSVDASGPDPKLLGSVQLPGSANSYGSSAQLLIAGDRALVISQRGYYYAGGGGGPVPLLYPYPGGGGSLLAEYDISNTSQPKLLQTMKLEGSYVSARLTGRTARVVISATPVYPAAEAPNVAPQGGSTTTGRGPAAIRHSTLKTRGPKWLPTGIVHAGGSGRSVARPLTPCRDIEHPADFSGLETLTVLTIDLDRGLPPVDSEAVTTGGSIVYASTDNLYVGTERWATESSDPGVVSDVTTEIHRFDVSHPDETTYEASGEVPGFMLNQWSMSEQDGKLRVASTTSPPWTESGQTTKSQSFVTVLERRGDELAKIGRLGGLGTNQQIYAVRFIGDTGYVVTFRQVDPLYVLDLSDPESPKLAGHLEIPGYSAYLHPLGGSLLLGVGQGATNDGRLLGTQLSVFDVSDPANPRAIDQQLVASHASSEVEYDHHAFTYWSPTGLVVIPVSYFDDKTGEQTFDGAIGFHAGAGGVDEVGRLSDGKPPHSIPMRRSLVIGDRLYAISDGAVIAVDLGTLTPTGAVSFPGSN